jgi:hypothetical protein
VVRLPVRVVKHEDGLADLGGVARYSEEEEVRVASRRPLGADEVRLANRLEALGPL